MRPRAHRRELGAAEVTPRGTNISSEPGDGTDTESSTAFGRIASPEKGNLIVTSMASGNGHARRLDTSSDVFHGIRPRSFAVLGGEVLKQDIQNQERPQ
ncbi:MAG: hypothetical protein HYV63_19390 [Candidatus Schekmanbacteria bacterium]|nr:hypothetical protein [Candidatus Schekmanbacteria bacterium]